jgi:hypothetical protein
MKADAVGGSRLSSEVRRYPLRHDCVGSEEQMEQIARTSNTSCGAGPRCSVHEVVHPSMIKQSEAARSTPVVGLIAKALMLLAAVPAQAKVNGLPTTWTVQNFDGSTSVCRRNKDDLGSTCEVQSGSPPVRLGEREPQSYPKTNQPAGSLSKVWTVQNFDGSTSVCRRNKDDLGSTCEVQSGSPPVRLGEREPQSYPKPTVPTQESRSGINWGDVLVGALILGAVAYAASNGAYGGGGYSTAVSDYKWSWDQFRDGNGVLIWRCRGEQTGQFADDWRCAGLYRADSKWPGPQLY